MDVTAALTVETCEACGFFAGTSPSYQRIRAAHVVAARARLVEFERRSARLVEAFAAGRTFGSGISECF